jgi:hypothetical protein
VVGRSFAGASVEKSLGSPELIHGFSSIAAQESVPCCLQRGVVPARIRRCTLDTILSSSGASAKEAREESSTC